MIAVLWAYEGWQFGTYSAGEVIDPQKSFPRAFLIGSLILVALYLTANVAYLIALGPAASTASDAIAATAASSVLGPWAGKLVALAILISVFSSTNSVIPHRAARALLRHGQRDNLFFKTLREGPPAHRHSCHLVADHLSRSLVTPSSPAPAGCAELHRRRNLHRCWIFTGTRRRRGIFPASPQIRPTRNYPTASPATCSRHSSSRSRCRRAIVADAIILAFHVPASISSTSPSLIILFLLGLPAYAFWRRHSAS